MWDEEAKHIPLFMASTAFKYSTKKNSSCNTNSYVFAWDVMSSSFDRRLDFNKDRTPN
ncbi:hypothetical protein K435DRAFT_233159 [Dendrothele bispora CBS 962.96]|uniref:Uncharacterized protein n=1 Tax=Dendrothele bispora (strain CBS 962.96) TaxID=1314807 RepID=A0A4S8LBS9_DENBC|nr:hypothetical protein K435DRAFT_370551 [Dendrothele bispora CBS 962.96]THU91541.1 hypothetical protein K435DRAFT_233159 [Dendrothele bispora CBS 962.96]